MTAHQHAHAEFPLGPFRPYEQNPIMTPQGDGWESGSVYNPAAIVKDGQVVLLYRAHADDIISHVGYATSDRAPVGSSSPPRTESWAPSTPAR